jgi:prepilin-type N-terminal cleavage/methylation domain-containing protein
LSVARRIDGFTLIELVACIVIMAVLAAIAGPHFFGSQPFTERGYAHEIAAALRSARQVAVASACEVQVTIDPLTGYEALQRAAAGNTCSPAGAWTTPVTLSDGNLLANAPPSGATVASATTIIFGAQGQVTSGAPPPVSVGAFNVTVDQTSGFVSP